MATVILDLRDCMITDTGEVIVKYDHLVYGLLLDGKPIKGLKTLQYSQAEWYVHTGFRDLTDQPPSDVAYHNFRCDDPDRIIPIVAPDGVAERPAPECFEYDIPPEYLKIDLVEYCVTRLSVLFPDTIPSTYVDRLKSEYEEICERQMQDWIRSMIYVIDTLDANHVIHGVGRGSSCASLMLVLIGVHMVDPVLYDIPIDEFLR